jgi:hypothetical protein
VQPLHSMRARRCTEARAEGRRGRHIGSEVDDAPGRVAIEGGRRSPDDLDRSDRLEIDVIDGCLAVGKGERDAIAQHPDATDTERRARAEATDGDPRILSRVVPVRDRDPGDEEESLIEREQARSGAQAVRTHGRDGVWQLERRARGLAGDRHLNGRQPGGGRTILGTHRRRDDNTEDEQDAGRRGAPATAAGGARFLEHAPEDRACDGSATAPPRAACFVRSR